MTTNIRQRFADPKLDECDGWFSAAHTHQRDGLTVVGEWRLCPDCLAEYEQDKYEQNEYGAQNLAERG